MSEKARFAVAGVLILVAAMFLVSCGGDDDDSSSGGASPGSTSSSGSQASSNASRDIKIEQKDFSYEGPDQVGSGVVRISASNTGQEPHQAQIFRLNDGVTSAQLDGALKSGDLGQLFNIGAFFGGPNAIPPGASQVVYNNLQPGNYALLCFIESDDGVPHFAKGQVKLFTVTQGGSGEANAPKTDGSVTMADFNFLGNVTSLPAKKTTLEVKNGGPQPHELTMIQLNDGITVDQIKAVLNSPTPPTGPVPIGDAGGLGAIQANATGYVEFDLKAGQYAFICFVPDAATGKPHAALGMIKAIEVK